MQSLIIIIIITIITILYPENKNRHLKTIKSVPFLESESDDDVVHSEMYKKSVQFSVDICSENKRWMATLDGSN